MCIGFSGPTEWPRSLIFYNAPTRLNFDQMPLKDAIASICKQASVRCRIEGSAIADAPITLKGSEKVQLHRALDALACIGDLTWKVEAEWDVGRPSRVVFTKAAPGKEPPAPLDQTVRVDVQDTTFAEGLLAFCRDLRVGCIVDRSAKCHALTLVQCMLDKRPDSAPKYSLSIPAPATMLKVVEVLTTLTGSEWRIKNRASGIGPPTLLFGERVPVEILKAPESRALFI
ncbi:MAG: hypothetical protein ACREJQ_09160 [bacterium]